MKPPKTKLTKFQIEVLLPLVVKQIIDREQTSVPISNTHINKSLSLQGHKVDSAMVRHIINYIRVKLIVPGLVANSKGYFITKDAIELKKQIDSLANKEHELRRVRKSFEITYTEIVGTNQFQLNI